MGGPFEARSDGTIAVRLTDAEADVLRRVADDLLRAIDAPGEPSLRRLFPPAYEKDERREADFERMTRDELLEAKRGSARGLIASLDAGKGRRGRWSGVLDEEAAGAWLGVLNDARLVLGVRLDITEDTDYSALPPTDPRAPAMNLYFYLSALEDALIDVLAAWTRGD